MPFDFQPAPHEQAAALIRGKPVLARSVFDQLLPELRARAFTIAGVESANVQQRVRDSIATIAEGTNWDDAKDEIIAELDPFLGDNSERRAELLLRTHGFQAFQAANWQYAQADDDTTHLQYLTMEDDRVRPGHAALDGVIVPKDDPFWQTHFPPWEWGCRCRTRPMNPDLVDEARKKDEDRPPDDQLVFHGAALRKLREGTLVRNGQTHSILPSPDESAFAWHPDNLTIPLDQLQARYDPEVWAAFRQWAKGQELEPGLSVWQWLNAPEAVPVRPVQFATAPEARAWADANMHPDNLDLSSDSREKLAEYQGASNILNGALQRGKLNAAQSASVRAIDDAMDQSRLDHSIVVWHGSSSAFWGGLEEGSEAALASYLSTTLAEDFQEFRGGAWVKITVPKGARAFYMDKMDGYEGHAQEVEMVLPRDSRLRVNSVAHRDGHVYIEAELIA